MTTPPRERDTVGLFQVDGKWPNLALMHLASWIRGLGAMALRIGPLEQEICTIVYASKTFSFSRSDYIRDDAIRGGTGWDDWRSLPQLPYEAEHSYPAYDLWNCNEAMGFLTRGCIRRCPFCIVPDKEGPIRHHSHLSEWWRGQRRIRLLDANITAHPDVLEYLDELAFSQAEVDFSQGIDARLVTPEIAKAIARVRRYKQLHIAWDDIGSESAVLRGVACLFKELPRGSLMAYVLIGYNSTPEEDYYRVIKLREMGVDPFVMPYDKTNDYQRRFARWVNHKAIFKSVAWEEYGHKPATEIGGGLI